MKYYTICFPGEYGQNVVETWSVDQIMESYYPYWCRKMKEKFENPYLDRDRCLDDWIVVNWAVETDKWGNKLPIEQEKIECWCRKCHEGHVVGEIGGFQIPYAMSVMIVCPKCGNKRCPHASDHNYECTGSNEPGQEGSVY